VRRAAARVGVSGPGDELVEDLAAAKQDRGRRALEEGKRPLTRRQDDREDLAERRSPRPRLVGVRGREAGGPREIGRRFPAVRAGVIQGGARECDAPTSRARLDRC
jgi:hypothetical protein